MSQPSGPRREGHPKVSVVIPVFNEEESLPPLVEELEAALGSLDAESEVIFVDDGSTDQSLEVLRQLQEQSGLHLRIVVMEDNCGQSGAFAAGFRAARGSVIATLDADLQNDPGDLPTLYRLLDRYDMVCGWRRQRRDPWIRRVSTRVSNAFRARVLQDGFHDTGCSLRVFRRECILNLPLFDGMHRFLPTLVQMAGFRVGEEVVNHRPRKFGVAKYNIRNRLFHALADLLGVLWLRRRTIGCRVRQEA